MKIVIAESDGVLADPRGIQALLELIGHPEALVTDESRLSDFDLHELTVPIRGDEITLAGKLTLLEALFCLREFEPAWPKASTRQ